MGNHQRIESESEPLIQVRDNADRHEKLVIVKDLVVMTVSFLLVFSAYNALQNLESSLNREHGVGLASLSCIYGGIVFSCILAPFLINTAGAKWTVCLGFVIHILFTASNFYPRLYTLIPSSLLLGFASGPLWTAQGAYVTKLSLRYAALLNLVDHTPTLSRFNGFFFTVHQSSNIWGNLFSSLVLHRNASDSRNSSSGSQCGANFCPGVTQVSNISQSSKDLVYIVLSIFLGCGILGFLVALIFLGKPEGNQGNSESRGTDLSLKQKLVATFALMKDRRLIALIPLFAFTGVEQAFIVGSYPLAFVSCEHGVENVGFIMACMGACSMVGAFVAGFFEKWTGQLPWFLMVGGLNGSLMVAMLAMKGTISNVAVVYILAGSWGIVDGIYQSQTGTLVGSLFADKPEAGFANWVMFKCGAQSIVFGYTQSACVSTQLYIALALLVIASVLLVGLYVKTKFRN